MKNTINKDLRSKGKGKGKSRVITLCITDEIRLEMEQYPEVNWNEVVRTGIKKYIAKRKLVKEEK